MINILGRKIGMTQVFNEDGKVIPVTVLQAGPCPVLDIKTEKRDSYKATQIGFEEVKDKNTSKALKKHSEKANLAKVPRFIREIPYQENKKLGDFVTLKDFSEVKFVDVIGHTKGKGFQGVVKRYNFGGGRASHGGDWLRKTGSIGMCKFPGKVLKGKKMPGHMGNRKKTVQNLQVVDIRIEDNIILIKGAIPGFNGSFVTIRKAKKK